MLKKRFSRFLLLLLTIGAVFGIVYSFKLIGLIDKIFPNFKDVEGFQLWMPLLPPAVLAILGQLFGDVLNLKFMDNRFFDFIKRILFLAVAISSIIWYVYSYDDYSVRLLDIESIYMSVGIVGTLFVYTAYVFAYVFWTKKTMFPFFFIIPLIATLIVDFLLCKFWPEGGFWVPIILAVVLVVVFFVKPDDRLFDVRGLSPREDPKKIIADLAYLNDPNYRPGLDRDYDENGHYFGAKCGNCAHCKKTYDRLGFTELYCGLTNQGCNDHDSCSSYKRAK